MDVRAQPPVSSRLLFLIALTAAAFAVRLLLYLQTPEPLGTDGYYYVVQLEDLIATGSLHVPDGSWVLYFLGLCAWLVGDVVLGLKVGAALLAALCVPGAWLVGGTINYHNNPAGNLVFHNWPAWLLALWAAASPTLTHLGGDFPKNLGMAAPLLFLIAIAVRARWSLTWVILGAGSLFLALTAHRLSAAVVGLMLLGGLLGSLLGVDGLSLSNTRVRRITMAIVSVVFLAFAILSAVNPNLLHPADMERLHGQFDFSLGWPAPLSYLALRQTHPLQVIELLVPWGAIVLALYAWWRYPTRRAMLAAFLLPLGAAIFPFWRRDVLDIGYRLNLIAPIIAFPLLVAALPPIHWRKRHRIRAALAFAGYLAITAPLVWTSRVGFRPDNTPPYATYREVIDAIPRPLPELLIAHQGINFLYDHRTGHEAMAWAPREALDRVRIGRVVWGVGAGEWLEFLSQGFAGPPPYPLPHGYTYVREDVWELFRGAAQTAGDDDLSARINDWRNPRRVRSAAMLRNRD